MMPFVCVRFPVVAMGVLKWVDWTVSEPRYFQLQTDHTPIHLALLDEVKLLLNIYIALIQTSVVILLQFW